MKNGEYILTEDTGRIMETVYGTNKPDANSTYLKNLAQILQESTVTSTVTMFTEKEIEASLEDKVRDRLDANPYDVCLLLDRFLLKKLESEYGDRIKRLSITRSQSGQKISRPQQPDIDAQIASLSEPPQDGSLFLVDDGFFSGGTAEEISRRLLDKDMQVTEGIGFLSPTIVESPLSIEVDQTIPQLDEWVDIRDFGIFGGKIEKKSRDGKVAVAAPYIAPWSDGSAASLDRQPDFFEISKQMISAQKALIDSYDVPGKPLTMRELIQAGFAVPVNKERSLDLTLNTPVLQYLSKASEAIESEQERQVVVLDMDGTLYDLIPERDGKGFEGSLLRAEVERNAERFLAERFGDEAEQIVQTALKDKVGISAYLEATYGIPRSEYFNEVWDISPAGRITTDSAVQDALAEKPGGFGTNTPKRILLTSAPLVWANNVLTYLGLSEAFEVVYTGDTYGLKTEIFDLIAARYLPENVLSIGDQIATDVQPAIDRGMRGVVVTSPEQTAALLREQGV